jgi:hypothetical protein
LSAVVEVSGVILKRSSMWALAQAPLLGVED